MACGTAAFAFEFNLDVVINANGGQSQIQDPDEEFAEFYEEDQGPSLTEDDLYAADYNCQDRGYDLATGMVIDGERVYFFDEDDFDGRSYQEQFRLDYSNRKQIIYCAYLNDGYERPSVNFDFSMIFGGNQNQHRPRHGFPGIPENEMAPAVLPAQPGFNVDPGYNPEAPAILPGLDPNYPVPMAPAGSTF